MGEQQKFWMFHAGFAHAVIEESPHIHHGPIVSVKAKLLVNRNGIFFPCNFRECHISDDVGHEEWDQFVPDMNEPAFVRSDLEVVHVATFTQKDRRDPGEALRFLARELMTNPYCDARYAWYNGSIEVKKRGWFGFTQRFYEHEFVMLASRFPARAPVIPIRRVS